MYRIDDNRLQSIQLAFTSHAYRLFYPSYYLHDRVICIVAAHSVSTVNVRLLLSNDVDLSHIYITYVPNMKIDICLSEGLNFYRSAHGTSRAPVAIRLIGT